MFPLIASDMHIVVVLVHSIDNYFSKLVYFIYKIYTLRKTRLERLRQLLYRIFFISRHLHNKN